MFIFQFKVREVPLVY